MSTNPITGDKLASKVLSGESKRKFDENFEFIFKRPNLMVIDDKPSDEDWDDDQESRIK